MHAMVAATPPQTDAETPDFDSASITTLLPNQNFLVSFAESDATSLPDSAIVTIEDQRTVALECAEIKHVLFSVFSLKRLDQTSYETLMTAATTLLSHLQLHPENTAKAHAGTQLQEKIEQFNSSPSPSTALALLTTMQKIAAKHFSMVIEGHQATWACSFDLKSSGVAITVLTLIAFFGIYFFVINPDACTIL